MGFVLPVEVAGGWDAWQNIESAQGVSPSFQPSGYWPLPQRNIVEHLPIEPAGGQGLLVPQIDPDFPSMGEMLALQADDYLYSDFGAEFSPAYRNKESNWLAGVISSPYEQSKVFLGDIYDKAGQGLSWALDTKQTITTLWDEFNQEFLGREPVAKASHQPEYYKSTEEHYNELTQRAAETYNAIGEWFGNIQEQAKGLFSRGFPQYSKQPTSSILPGVPAQLAGVVSIGLVVLVIYFLVKK